MHRLRLITKRFGSDEIFSRPSPFLCTKPVMKNVRGCDGKKRRFQHIDRKPPTHPDTYISDRVQIEYRTHYNTLLHVIVQEERVVSVDHSTGSV